MMRPNTAVRFCSLAVALLSWAAPPIRAQQTDPSTKRLLPAVQTDTPPVIDGDLSDAAWKTSPKAERFYDREQGSVATDQTEAWLTYDGTYLYVAFYCRDSLPEKIVARETVRDQKYSGNGFSDQDTEDNVEFTLDPFLSWQENDLAKFSVNAIGTRSARASGGRAAKAEWKGDWDAAVKRVADGWTAEMRIPWKTLNYPSKSTPVTMGVNFWRFQERTKIQSVWSNVGQQRFNELEGRWEGVKVPAGAFRPHLSILPYVMPGFDRSRPTLRSGVDARYTLTPEMTAVATLNPDFGTIEGAVEGIQFSRSERFVEERRPFFLEGRDYFQAGDFFSIGPYFYSNRIRGFDVGTKVYGKITPNDTLGFLHTIDFRHEQNVVTRYRHEISPTQSAGFFFSQKTAHDDNNAAGFLMHNVRWGKFGIDMHAGKSAGRDSGGDAEQLNFTYQDTNSFTSLLLLNVAQNFRDANGLLFYTDYRGVSLYNEWSAEWRKGFWRSFSTDFYPSIYWHTDGRPFRTGGGIGARIDTRSDWRFRIDYNHERFDDTTDRTISFRIRRGISNRFRQWGIQFATGMQADRRYRFFGPEGSVRVLRKLDLAYGAGIQQYLGTTQQHILTMNYELSPTRSIGGRVVVFDSYTNWYVSYRNSGERGTEVYFIIGDPNALRFREQVRLKLVFAI